MAVDETREFIPLNIAVLTISDSRRPTEDISGDRLVKLLIDDGHRLADRDIIHDEADLIVARLHNWIDDPAVDCVVCTGGTGVTGRDVTPEALHRLDGKDIPGFGELFRWLSYAKIGTSTIQSRACACVTRGTFVFALPGSPSAVIDGWEGILRNQLDSRHRPCNFAELLPRLTER
ncbi:MAG: molybdenum cofactor biosynthesis protein B [Sphingomonadales bacterium]|nr:molybdenum cofactor biosynthesis protein B [Sphingomonadales bacterium]